MSSTLKLEADPVVIGHIIKQKFGGKVVNVIAAWDQMFPDRTLDRTAFYGWAKGKLPRTKEDFLRWAAVLDADPVSLFKVPEDRVREMAQWLANKFMNRNMGTGPVSVIRQLYEAHPLWPSKELVKPFFKRDWFSQEVVHDPAERSDFYAAIELHDPDWDGFTPRVYHFSYRRDIPEAMFWIPYGTVVRTPDRIRSMHMVAMGYDKDPKPVGEPTVVGTYFGAGPAVFKIVSIHPFTAKVGPDQPLDEIPHFIK